ncbi:hypothetical protein K239x_34070 [Planctomycetes bacterium K23_9]|uniref:Uncharacterized protein n=1 Tax=Stieleria marina TaxID=1930275 RepID=A0A517NWA0_9BACT|nr:hypothetical protein K239x_34070 [Planctomycetes bacterium K23_9]
MVFAAVGALEVDRSATQFQCALELRDQVCVITSAILNFQIQLESHKPRSNRRRFRTRQT